MNYAMEVERAREASTHGRDDTSLGDEVLEILDDTLEMLKEMAAESGVDLNAVEADENPETDAEFPAARSFVRPGFDEPELW
ncbi:MAG: hypothetical protein N2204_06775 [Anaerolineae bacterium]|nr:hypothetical protein [Anaerolineae bacterium]